MLQAPRATYGSLVPPVLFRLLEVSLRLETDDPLFVQEFAALCGRPCAEATADPCPRGAVVASLRRPRGDGREPGILTVSGDGLEDPVAFLLRLASATVPLRPAGGQGDGGARALALGEDLRPVLWFVGEECRFEAVPRWRRILSHFLLFRLLRLRSDALFFHAASVGVAGRGALLVGPKGSGKTTLALALAARGHAFLGDETACYLPSGELAPLWRPVGIKPGPQAAAVRAALGRRGAPPDEDGVLRVDAAELVDIRPPSALRLADVVFLEEGFAPRPVLWRVEPGREELARLQPLAITLAEGPATGRVFAMIRLLGAVRAHRLRPGDPDETARLLEQALGAPC